MKHNVKVTLILLGMFLIAQLVALAVINAYSPHTTQIINQTTGIAQNVTITPQLPYGMQPPEIKPEISLLSIIISFAIVFTIFFLLIRTRASIVMIIWFGEMLLLMERL